MHEADTVNCNWFIITLVVVLLSLTQLFKVLLYYPGIVRDTTCLDCSGTLTVAVL